MPIPVSRGRLPAPVQVVTREGSNSRRLEDETTAAEPSVASPGSLRADAGRLRAVQGRGILVTMGKWWQLSDFHFKARGRGYLPIAGPSLLGQTRPTYLRLYLICESIWEGPASVNRPPIRLAAGTQRRLGKRILHAIRYR